MTRILLLQAGSPSRAIALLSPASIRASRCPSTGGQSSHTHARRKGTAFPSSARSVSPSHGLTAWRYAPPPSLCSKARAATTSAASWTKAWFGGAWPAAMVHICPTTTYKANIHGHATFISLDPVPLSGSVPSGTVAQSTDDTVLVRRHFPVDTFLTMTIFRGRTTATCSTVLWWACCLGELGNCRARRAYRRYTRR